jgi:hypothetical protein
MKKAERPLVGRDEAAVPFRLPSLPKFFSWRKPKDTLPEPFGADLRDLGPVHACTCGCTMFNIMASFEDYDIAWWFLEGTCANCGNMLTIPCPADNPDK